MSTIKAHQRAIRWAPNQPEHKPRCADCTQSHWTTFAGRPALQCTAHGFYTFTHATCERHQPKGTRK